MKTRNVPPQKTRAIFLFVYLVLLVIVSKIFFGEWIPPATGGKAVWFYAGVASLLLGNHLVTPYFSKPVDAISYGVASMAALFGAEEISKWNASETAFFYFAVGYSIFVVCISFCAIFFRSDRRIFSQISQTCTYLAETFGNHRAVFGITILVAAYIFHRNSSVETFWICVVCIVCVVARPDEVFSALISQLGKIWANVYKQKGLGVIVAEQAPNVFLVRQMEGGPTEFGAAVIIKLPDQSEFLAFALDIVGRDEAILLRCLKVLAFDATFDASDAFPFQKVPDQSAVLVTKDSQIANGYLHAQENCRLRLVGLVAANTSTERLFFEVVSIQSIRQGQLVQVKCQQSTIVYQILDGLTYEEIVFQKNTNGIVRAQAKKIGVWDAQARKFVPSAWLPALNEPVLLAEETSMIENEHTIGRFPGGSYPVQLSNINQLVTHNTAILGILGVGKSMLAIELVERMIASNIKVICLDLTDQYQKELADFCDVDAEKNESDELYAFGGIGRTNYNANIEFGGSVREFRLRLSNFISSFLANENQSIKIFNPARFDVWKQVTNQFKPADIPGMAQLTACQITQIISEVVLECTQQLGMSTTARICLVYEEAHSLVPEWNSVAFEGDKTATAGTARAILQGRKYGFGCLLITQRTANVTKTILNQCNTIFAMRTFDDTGKEFLSNYVGRDYAQTLSSLREREAVFFGRASNCENPVLIRLNDKDEFRELFRAKHPPNIKKPSASVGLNLM